MSSKSIYCVYLISYFGSKLPQFYIGSTSLYNISKGYMGSVSSKKYKSIWKSELKSNPHLFKLSIISTHYNRESAVNKEEYFHRKLNVVSSPMYVNMTIANKGWGSLSGKDNPMYGITLKCNVDRMKLNNPMKNPDVAKKVSLSKMGTPAWNKGTKNPKQKDIFTKSNPAFIRCSCVVCGMNLPQTHLTQHYNARHIHETHPLEASTPASDLT